MTQQKLNSMSYDEVMQIEGTCEGVSWSEGDERIDMTLGEYAEGGWIEEYDETTRDFKFKDGGYITIEKNEENEEFGYDYKAIFIDEAGEKSHFKIMF